VTGTSASRRAATTGRSSTGRRSTPSSRRSPRRTATRTAAKRLGEFSSLLENGVDHCINQCTSANNDEQTDCMINAKTADVAEKCVK